MTRVARSVQLSFGMSNDGPAIYFASGASRPADIRGFARIGHAIGVAASELSPNAVRELESLAGRSIPVFVDSGAFSEMEFTAEGPKVVRPISDAQWAARLALYARLATALGSSVYLVAPDRIGDQEETLRRLTVFAPQLRELRALGARILVPVQRGNRSQVEFVRDVTAALGFDDFVHAIPSKKNATTMAQLAEYVQAVRPHAVHLLGLGVKNANAGRALAIIADAVPGCVVTMDSNLIAASVGRSEARPRKLTRARDRAAAMIAAGLLGYLSAQELGIVLAFGSPADVAAVEAAADFTARVVPRALELCRRLVPEITVTVLDVQPMSRVA